jgi:hypothetical protein
MHRLPAAGDPKAMLRVGEHASMLQVCFLGAGVREAEACPALAQHDLRERTSATEGELEVLQLAHA